MRAAIVILVCAPALFSGCVSVPGLRAEAHSDRLVRIKSECQSTGSSPGTSKYARCVTEEDRAENARVESEREAAVAAGMEAARRYSIESNAREQPADMECNFRKDGKYTCISE
jgi:hypothetical protein